MFKKCCIIANPIAGNRTDRQDVFGFVAKRIGQSVADCVLKFTRQRGDATDIAFRAVQDGSDLVVVIGGDGTINEAAAALVNTSVAMGIIPCGSGNGLARSLEIPLSVSGACELIRAGAAKPIDVGKINERFFFLVAGVGFDAVVGKRFDDLEKRGALAYFCAGAKAFLRYQPVAVRLSFDGRTLEGEPFLVAIANGRQYGNNALIAPDAKLDDGLFDIAIIHRFTTWDAAVHLPKLFNGGIRDFPHAELYRSSSVCIERPQEGFVNIDGDACWDGKQLKITLLPKAINIVVPQNVASLVQ